MRNIDSLFIEIKSNTNSKNIKRKYSCFQDLIADSLKSLRHDYCGKGGGCVFISKQKLSGFIYFQIGSNNEKSS